MHDTFHDAARARGLVTGDEEYFICMQEATSFQTANLLRGLPVTLIIDGAPAAKLWQDFKDDLIEDFRMSMTRAQAIAQALWEIDLKLKLHGRDNEQVNIPAAIHQQSELQRTRGAFDRIEQTTYADDNENLLTQEQRVIYSTIIESVTLNKPGAYMADSPAGTGKTFTEKVIAARLRGNGRVVLTVASTGIAALQLPGGWTAHSMFNLPLDENVVPGAVCKIRSESQRAELIRNCDLIIWDELPMSHKYCVEALNTTLQDLLNNDSLFGGKTILFSGDWRQVDPVVKYGPASDTVEAAVISSFLWNNIACLRLTVSQQDKEDPQYAFFVRAVGEDRQAVNTSNGNMIALSNNGTNSTTDNFTLKFATDFEDLVEFVYPDLNEDTHLMHDRAIVATANTAIDASNKDIAERRSENATSFFSSDTLISDESNPYTAFAAPEHLNLLNAQGVPPHQLELRSNDLAMLTRNFNFG